MSRTTFAYRPLCLLPLCFLLSANSACEKNPVEDNTDPVTEVEEKGEVRVYTTTADQKYCFRLTELSFQEIPGLNDNIVTIKDAEKYQSVDGFGAAVTGATCHNLLKMSQENRTAFLQEIFDMKDGLGVSLIRVSIGSSDFGMDEYTWCDEKGMENFAVNKWDRDELFPVLREIYAINPQLKIVASPWSAPRWMKRKVNSDADMNSWTSGRLKKECYEDYASYFVKWIQTMQAEGFDIYAMTIQNEPLNHGNSMSMYMSWQEQRDFIKTALGPAFEKNRIGTKILVFDHNYNYDGLAGQKSYPLNIYADPEASRYVAGSAWHNYGGSVKELSNIVDKAPEKEIYFTEASIGTWNYDFSKCLLNDFRDIFMNTLSRGCMGVTLWNLLLDEKRGPFRPGGCSTCFGAVTMNSSSATITSRQSHYYNIAHTSKVIKPGAVRIAASGYARTGLMYQAYLNPDGSHSVIILNEGESTSLVFKEGSRSVKCGVPSKSIVSLIW